MDIADLPELAEISAQLRNGRSVRDGYARGWGLAYGKVAQLVAADPLYREAMAVASGRTWVAEARRMNLFLLLKFYLPRLAPGNIVEFGTYRGGNALFMALVASRILPGVKVFALDTFEGMPAEDTAAGVVARAAPFALAHIDCDIFSAVACAYEAIMPAMVPGGYVVFDDATESSCIGATEAVESLVIRRDGLSSEQIHPHFVFRAPQG
jgi:SAM-dependent methyltransferase